MPFVNTLGREPSQTGFLGSCLLSSIGYGMYDCLCPLLALQQGHTVMSLLIDANAFYCYDNRESLMLVGGREQGGRWGHGLACLLWQSNDNDGGDDGY